MTESMLSRYHRWIFESGKTESVECLREWILQEAEFQTIASETIHGLSANTSSNSQRNYKGNRRDGFRTFFGESQNESYTGNRMCKCCNGNHGVWSTCNIENGNRTVSVNALLDDASTKTYINADVAAELGLQGQVQKVTVNVLNDNIETFETMPQSRKYPVALVCDIAEMYLRIKIAPDDRTVSQDFFYGAMKTEQYHKSMNSIVLFGVNSSSFQAQFVSRKHAEMTKDSYPRAAENSSQIYIHG
ncbi:unnamed protein product [Mytilus edulis]|uniref:Uncharacterized protein n=1 Tax=Mytilus edulis TaxID=6550 RepID=A0A8S3S3W3_MYTED|nr:unnamed protein product [Mytilus edulis]